jgi:hypothetical protein
LPHSKRPSFTLNHFLIRVWLLTCSELIFCRLY